MILVSACLAGINCKYNGQNNVCSKVFDIISNGEGILICPEQLGGCSTPRPAAEIAGGTGADVLDGKSRVINASGEDVTVQFIKGAEEVLKIAKLTGAKEALLRYGSPSCGCGKIYDGTFSGQMTDGNGVTAEILQRNGIKVKTEKDI